LKRLKLLIVIAGFLGLGLAATLYRLTHRALPVIDGRLRVPGLAGQTEIVRDRWGIPHIFADRDEDAYFALGFATAQDRLFQMDLTRHVAQARLSEIFGERTLKADRLFRTMDFAGVGRRMVARARPEARAALDAYCRGVNAAVAALGGRLPVEFTLLGHDFEPATPEEFVGVLGYMTWGLNISWHFDPLYERLAQRLGEEKVAELFPWNRGGLPSVHPAAAPPAPNRLGLFRLLPEEEGLLASVPTLRASNNWVVGPGKSASGKPILANDPHLSHGLPAIWYQAHLKTPTQDVIGVTVPGLPLIVIGHNRQIAWGFTNVMQDAADFFVEKLNPEQPDQVLFKNQWVKIASRQETIQVKGAPPVTITIRSTPHGPLVSDLLPEEKQALAYRWTYSAAEEANELDGFYALDRAGNWEEFRAALKHFGAVAQNVVYADRDGHIGMQTAGVFPRLTGRSDGTRFRRGWDGSEEWDGFHAFDENPASFDPPQGWLASANNSTVTASSPFYISSQWEPADRILRIQELLQAKDKLSIDDVRRMQADTTLVSARELTPRIVEAFAKRPPGSEVVTSALSQLRGWGGEMRTDQAAPTLFASFYKRLFYELFEDEFGPELAQAYRAKANLSAIMIRAVFEDGHDRWFDRTDTPQIEDADWVLRSAFEKAVADLARSLGGSPASWTWGRVHTLELAHPLGKASRLLGFYFDRGPFPLAGHTSTVNKGEFAEEDFRVVHGPSMRQITDLADLGRALAVIPSGQSGIPASRHYDDLLKLWLAGEYHPFLMDRPEIDKVAEGRLVLEPAE